MFVRKVPDMLCERTDTTANYEASPQVVCGLIQSQTLLIDSLLLKCLAAGGFLPPGRSLFLSTIPILWTYFPLPLLHTHTRTCLFLMWPSSSFGRHNNRATGLLVCSLWNTPHTYLCLSKHPTTPSFNPRHHYWPKGKRSDWFIFLLLTNPDLLCTLWPG